MFGNIRSIMYIHMCTYSIYLYNYIFIIIFFLVVIHFLFSNCYTCYFLQKVLFSYKFNGMYILNALYMSMRTISITALKILTAIFVPYQNVF